ncbi:hypothetical protein X777_02386 [Ooceraea biroi]|uniref:Uncharacterized protein n=1 Tax=Ooceraea biroi TaxID=2015173 RepID=A0A026VTB2_OOCBI|nr:hypothetical protein X777_02386 [Ooceraea biroi]
MIALLKKENIKLIEINAPSSRLNTFHVIALPFTDSTRLEFKKQSCVNSLY